MGHLSCIVEHIEKRHSIYDHRRSAAGVDRLHDISSAYLKMGIGTVFRRIQFFDEVVLDLDTCYYPDIRLRIE